MDDEPEELRDLCKTICFEVAEELRKEKGPSFIFDIMQDVCKVSPEDVFCFQTFRAEGKYDVHLHEKALCTEALQSLQAAVGTETLRGIDFSLGSVRREVPFTVHVANPFCPEEAIVAFLRMYCDEVGKGEKLYHSLGPWNGKRRFGVLLKLDEEGRIGNTLHPPAVFQIGACRGTLSYPRQPKFCDICCTVGHRKAECADTPCRHCGDKGHEEADCYFNFVEKHADGWDGTEEEEEDEYHDGWY